MEHHVYQITQLSCRIQKSLHGYMLLTNKATVLNCARARSISTYRRIVDLTITKDITEEDYALFSKDILTLIVFQIKKSFHIN